MGDLPESVTGSAARTLCGQAIGLPCDYLPEGRRGSEVKDGPQGRRLRRASALEPGGWPGTLRGVCRRRVRWPLSGPLGDHQRFTAS
jgi:hypothetical protein